MPNNAATKITIAEPTKKPVPLVLGLLEIDNRTIIRAKLVGLIAAARAMGTISKSKVSSSAILFFQLPKKKLNVKIN